MRGDDPQAVIRDPFDTVDTRTVTSIPEALWRFRWLVLVVAVAAGAAGYAFSFIQAPTYQAEAGMIVTDPRTSNVFEDGSSASGDLSRYVRNQAEFAESAAVAVRAAEILSASGLTAEGITSSVSVTPSRDLDLVTIRATQPTGAGAAQLANAIAEAYQQLVREQVQGNADAAIDELRESKVELASRVDSLETGLAANPDNPALQAERDAIIAQLVTLDTRIEQINVNMALYGSGVQYFEAAEVPLAPATPKPLRTAVVGMALGLAAAVALAFWRTEQLPIAVNRHDPAPILGAPLLGEIPDFSLAGAEAPAPTIFEPTSMAAEAYQFVVSSLDFALKAIEGSTVMVTSPGPAAGKTVTALNLSVAAVGDGTQLLLVDADERGSGLTRLAGSEAALGLTDLAQRQDLDLMDCVQGWQVSETSVLKVLPAGTRVDSTAAFFRSQEFRKLMASLRNTAPIVILDAPPVLAASETVDIATEADGIVLVIADGTPLRAIEETKNRLLMTDKPLLGYVFNRAVPRHGKYGYGKGYGYGYGYGYGRDQEESSSARAR